MTMARTIKLYKLHDEQQLPGWRLLRQTDIPAAHRLLHDYLKRFSLAPVFTAEEFSHWFLPRTDVVSTYVIEVCLIYSAPECSARTSWGIVQDASGTITDLCSFYYLPSTVVNHNKYKSVLAVYSFYQVAGKATPHQLMSEALIAAKKVSILSDTDTKHTGNLLVLCSVARTCSTRSI